MAERKNIDIIAFVGLSGTGKSESAQYLSQQGIPRVSFASIINTAVENAQLDVTPESETVVREKLRLDPTGDIVANKVIDEINRLYESGQHKIVVDGLSSWETLKRLKHEFQGNVTVIALLARRNVRHRRLADRAVRPMTAAQADARDYEEIETLNKGGIIAVADHYIMDNSSFEQLYTQIDKLQRDLEI